MPVKHDLYQDLDRSQEEVQKLRASDPHLNALLDKYADIDGQVVEAEKQQMADDGVKKLKEKRLLIKDEIAKKL